MYLMPLCLLCRGCFLFLYVLGILTTIFSVYIFCVLCITVEHYRLGFIITMRLYIVVICICDYFKLLVLAFQMHFNNPAFLLSSPQITAFVIFYTHFVDYTKLNFNFLSSCVHNLVPLLNFSLYH